MLIKKKNVFNLCVRHGFNYLGSDWDINFDIKKIISIKVSYKSMFIFSFKKKESDSFFIIDSLKKNNGSSL